MNSIPFKNQILFVIYFGLSALITRLFIAASPVYFSERQELLSLLIAGGKWGIQILAAFIFLGKQRWLFVKNIGFACFIGSCILLPYLFLSNMYISNDQKLFIGSLVASVIAMIYYYHKAVRLSMVALKWWAIWLLCLAVAIMLQLTVVFNVFSH